MGQNFEFKNSVPSTSLQFGHTRMGKMDGEFWDLITDDSFSDLQKFEVFSRVS